LPELTVAPVGQKARGGIEIAAESDEKYLEPTHASAKGKGKKPNASARKRRAG
jgi:hypothetical protein